MPVCISRRHIGLFFVVKAIKQPLEIYFFVFDPLQCARTTVYSNMLHLVKRAVKVAGGMHQTKTGPKQAERTFQEHNVLRPPNVHCVMNVYWEEVDCTNIISQGSDESPGTHAQGTGYP